MCGYSVRRTGNVGKKRMAYIYPKLEVDIKPHHVEASVTPRRINTKKNMPSTL